MLMRITLRRHASGRYYAMPDYYMMTLYAIVFIHTTGHVRVIIVVKTGHNNTTE